MRRLWSADELGERWSLLPEDLALLAGRIIVVLIRPRIDRADGHAYGLNFSSSLLDRQLRVLPASGRLPALIPAPVRRDSQGFPDAG